MKKAFLVVLIVSLKAISSYSQLISDTLVVRYSKKQVDSIYALNNLNLVSFIIGPTKYSIKIYRLKYKTLDAHGDTTTASGALFIPEYLACSAPLMSYQHATTTKKTDVPSYLSQESLIGIIFSTDGYVVSMPDYVGLGDSPGTHAYMNIKVTTSASIDMMRASKQFCAAHNIALNGKLFLMGYSQGGHATVGLHHELETNLSTEFHVTASAPASGPYALSDLIEAGIKSDTAFDYEGVLPAMLLRYQDMYGNIYDSIPQMFVAPYKTTLPPLLDGTHLITDVNAAMPAPAKLIFDSLYYKNYVSDSLHPFKVAARLNDVNYSWLPVAPVKLYYCKGDHAVPNKIAIDLYNKFIAAGASTSNVQKSDLGNYSHLDCAKFATINTKQWFDTFVQRCADAGVNDEPGSELQMEISPNPFSTETNIRFSNPASFPFELRIINLMGQEVLKKQNIKGETVSLTNEGLPAGSYILVLKGDRIYHGMVCHNAR